VADEAEVLAVLFICTASSELFNRWVRVLLLPLVALFVVVFLTTLVRSISTGFGLGFGLGGGGLVTGVGLG